MTILKFVCVPKVLKVFGDKSIKVAYCKIYKNKTQINKLWDVPKLIRLINTIVGIEVLVKF